MAAEGAGDLVRVVTLLGAAVVAVPLFRKLGLGAVLGYLAAGLAIGPYGFAVFTDAQAIIHVAELGVVMFLFVIGLEMKPSHLWHLRRQIFGLGSMQVVLAAAMMTVVGMLYGFSWQVSFVSASGFVLTSTAIVMSVLGERNELSSPRGQQMVSILLFEDLLIVPLLAIVSLLAPFHTASETPVWQSVGIAVLSLAALVAAGLWLLNPLFRILARAKAREVMTAAALLVVLGSALLMEAGGLSMAMGAFVAGVLLSESSFRHQLEADIEPFRGLLLGLFFLGVGMALDLQVVAENWWLVLSGVIALMAAKAAVIYGVARLAKSSHADALDRAMLMAQGGEFAFVLFSAAAAQGVIDARVNANMTAIVVLSMVLTPLMLVLYNRFAKPAVGAEKAADAIDEERPVIIIGMGRYGQIVEDVLRVAGHATTVIDKDADMVAAWNRYGVKTYFGDASRPELLLTAGLEKAQLLVVAIDNREEALRIVEFARKTSPHLKIIARAFDRPHTFELYQAGADDIVRETFDSALRSSRAALQALGMAENTAREVTNLYFRLDRHGMAAMARLYDPALGKFANEALIEEGQKQDQEMHDAIQALLAGVPDDGAEEGQGTCG
ncbi:MAG: monovalent cation:proton antiporter-2 (CPA2) family protein [Cardiobacteriaceae bacterium]|nr:monovalent cation:proton antiporter-2 (CPA2) family protein [Cardiobacteriaceae bacterium]